METASEGEGRWRKVVIRKAEKTEQNGETGQTECCTPECGCAAPEVSEAGDKAEETGCSCSEKTQEQEEDKADAEQK